MRARDGPPPSVNAVGERDQERLRGERHVPRLRERRPAGRGGGGAIGRGSSSAWPAQQNGLGAGVAPGGAPETRVELAGRYPCHPVVQPRVNCVTRGGPHRLAATAGSASGEFRTAQALMHTTCSAAVPIGAEATQRREERHGSAIARTTKRLRPATCAKWHTEPNGYAKVPTSSGHSPRPFRKISSKSSICAMKSSGRRGVISQRYKSATGL